MFYFYENWQADGHQAHVHRGECRFCNEGKGFRGTKSEAHGRWSQGYKTYEEARHAALRTGARVSGCKACGPWSF